MNRHQRANQYFYMPVDGWRVGDLVRVKHPGDLSVKEVTIALIIEVYERDASPTGRLGINLITDTGVILGNWELESWHKLELVSRTGLDYTYESVPKLVEDFKQGLFTPAFEIL